VKTWATISARTSLTLAARNAKAGSASVILSPEHSLRTTADASADDAAGNLRGKDGADNEPLIVALEGSEASAQGRLGLSSINSTI
jgi:hypothetical protein